MANPDHLDRLKRGVTAWNAWRRSRPKIDPDLSGANCEGADFQGADFRKADFEKAVLARVNFKGANLSDTNLTGANLKQSDFSRASLRRALLRKASVREASFHRTDLQDANFTLADLAGAEFSFHSSLRGVLFFGANLTRAVMSEIDFEGANLEEAHLRGADLSNSYLRDTILAKADLEGTNFTGAHFERTNLVGSLMGDTVFADNDLSTTMGPDSVRHMGPSTIGISTVYRSKGNIPESFLRGAGVPDEFITYMKSLAANPIEFYSCFISYSTRDQAFADRLYVDLQGKGVRCWFAPHDVQGGRKLHEQIDEAIRLHDKLLLILSPYSMESEWVKTEIAKARKREVRDRRRVLFPIRLAPFETLRDWECFDADAGKDSAREIREYFIPDFSNWKNHDSYVEAFTSLLKDLRAQDRATAVKA